MPLRSSKRPSFWATLVLTSGLFVGCSTSEKKLTYLGEAELQHYKDTVTSIDYPTVNEETPDEVSFTDEPRRIRSQSKGEIWNISLEEAIHTALGNNEIIRDNGQFLSPGNRLLTNPDFVQSVYDPALQDTSTLFGQNGPEAALSEFDANFTTNMLWGRSEQLSETTSFNGIRQGDQQVTESGDFRAGLSKIFAEGSQFQVSHNVLYQGFNHGTGTGLDRVFNSVYTNNPSATQNAGLAGIEFDFTKPLWAGSGVKFTRVAGPISRRPTLQNVPQVNQGVVISRIRTDLALADFEQALIGLTKDVEDVYWELYLAYRRYHSEMVARDSTLRIWREVKNKLNNEIEGGGAAEEAQARDTYFESRARSESAQAELYNSEGRLRRLLGLPVNDGRIMRPSDEPTTAEFLPDWRGSLVEALCRRVELRKQKWNIQSLEFQVEAAKSLTNPRLDFVSRYQMNGVGDKLFGDSPVKNTPVPGSFYDNLLSGKQNGWGLGFQFSMPLGFRAAHSQVRNLELKLAKAKASLGVQEHEISHELANSFRQLDASFQTAQTNFNRRRAAERRLQAFRAKYDAGQAKVDELLRSQQSLAIAEAAYYASLIQYNKAILDLKYRKGTLLQDDQVYLSESLSHPESYAQALRRAWGRSHGFDAPHLRTEPGEFVADGPDPVELGSATYSNPNGETPPTPPAPVPATESAPDQPGKVVPVPPQTLRGVPEDEVLPTSGGSITGLTEDEDDLVQPASYVAEKSPSKFAKPAGSQKKTLDLGDDSSDNGFQKPVPTQPRQPIMDDDVEVEEVDEVNDDLSFKKPISK